MCERIFVIIFVSFVCNALTHVETSRLVVLLALAFVCNFCLLRTFINWSKEVQAFKVTGNVLNIEYYF